MGLHRITCAAVACALSLTGCLERELALLDPRVSRAIDQPVGGDGVADVDLLIVVDDSGSMDEEQRILAEQIPLLVRGLTSPPDEDGDGAPDWNPVESLQVAIVTSDLGTSGFPISSLGGCGLSGRAREVWGLDGALRTDAACDPSLEPVQRWTSTDDAEAFVARVGCLARAGIGGCGIEQPLAAAARALERGRDLGFPREEALLAVLVLTDEEDCSIASPDAFFSSFPGAESGNQHCVDSASLLESVESLAAALTGGRDPESGRFVFAALAGLPVDLVDASPEAALADPRMAYVHDSGTTTGLRHACEAFDADGRPRSLATPGRRYLELARRLPGALVRSICEESFQPAIAELTRRIGARIHGACLNRALSPGPDGSVACVVREVLPSGVSCADLPARAALGADPETGRALCEVAQAPAGAGSGWWYDATDATCDRVRFTDDAVPPLGTRMRFRCLVEVETPDDGTLGG